MTGEKENEVQIVTAGVIEQVGKVLIARRKKAGYSGKRWEFPGGTLEAGETPEECLRRELREELSIEAAIGELICACRYTFNNARTIELMAYRAEHLSGDIELRDHDEIRWVELDQLPLYDFPEPDKPIVEKLIEEAARRAST